MFEHKTKPLLSRKLFLIRVAKGLALASLVVAGALFMGMAGYHYLENLNWLDSLLNASMILGGMGPATELRTDAGKLFASGYALFSGLIFLTITAIVLAPLIHRLIHGLHVERE